MQRNGTELQNEVEVTNSAMGNLKQPGGKSVSRRKRKSEAPEDNELVIVQEPVEKLNITKSNISQKSNSYGMQKSNNKSTTQQKRSVRRIPEIQNSADSQDLHQDDYNISGIDLLAKNQNKLKDLKKYDIVSSVPVFEKLCRRYEVLKNDSKAAAMSKYMRNKFVYFGIATPERKASCSDLWAEVKTLSSNELRTLAQITWNSPERELHYFATELLQKEVFRIYEDEDLTTGDLALKTLEFVKTFIDHPSSWWDTVDGLSPNVVGPLVQKYPNVLLPEMDKWNQSSCFWVCRASLLYQLSFKKDTDADRLFRYCLQVAEEEEFFIRKAIGWALRQYYRTDPKAVREFVLKHKNKLSPLSVKEALKHDKKHT
ncbi:unnamed protein product [Candidula unifasciata]|uniref:DNA alkylation repair protein n=1 Tax=Candidula unifasciata TaxID=100452 RepID=A0A8S3ZC19_9EUPU|nr:unnamed protein product [Candidula unifasciata]